MRTKARPQGQHVPQAPRRAHGQLSFVFVAPVCLFPSRRPQDSLLIRLAQPLSASLGQFAQSLLTWMKVGSGADSDNNSTATGTLPSSGQKIAYEV